VTTALALFPRSAFQIGTLMPIQSNAGLLIVTGSRKVVNGTILKYDFGFPSRFLRASCLRVVVPSRFFFALQ